MIRAIELAQGECIIDKYSMLTGASGLLNDWQGAEDIRLRMRLNPFDRLAELDNIHQIADAMLKAREASNE